MPGCAFDCLFAGFEIRWPNPRLAWFDRDDAAFEEFGAVPLENKNARRALGRCPDIDQANDSVVTRATDDGKLAEILVESHDNRAAVCRMRQDGGVPGVGRPIADVFHLVAVCQEFRLRRRRDAAIEKDSHEASGRTANSTRS
jgi:hypothetical protein